MPVECAEAARLINLRLSRRDLDAYRATIMRVGTGVAKSFREETGVASQFKLLWGRIIAPFRNEAYDPAAIVNISAAEERVLDMLARHLSAGADAALDDTGMPERQS